MTVSDTITGSLTLTTFSVQHALFNKKCASSSLDCPDNIEQNKQPVKPRPPANMPIPTTEPPIIEKPSSQPRPTYRPEPPKEETGEFIILS
jgi:hypothetical protein